MLYRQLATIWWDKVDFEKPEAEGGLGKTIPRRKVKSWGKRPGFRLTVVSYERGNRAVPQVSTEKLENFLPVAVKVSTPAGSKEPIVTQDGLDALRAYLKADSAEEPAEEETEEEDSRNSKKARKSAL